MILAPLLAAALSAAAAPAPAPVRAPALPGAALELKTVDGWTLHAVWQKAAEGKPTLVLLHGTGQRKEDWRPFARELAKGGYGYEAVDLRGHGESRTTPSGEAITPKKLRAVEKGANDYEDMTRDAEAAVAALVAQGVIEESIGVMGAEVGGSVAIKYAAVHPKVPFLIVLSPGLRWQEVLTVNAVRAFKGRATPILLVHSDADKRSSKETPLMYAFAKNAVGERNATLIVVPDERGTRMLHKNKGLTERVLAWLADPHPSAVVVSTEAAGGVAVDTAAAAATPAPDAVPDSEQAPLPESIPAPAPASGGDAL